MKVDKAIQVLSWENSQFPRAVNPDFTDALELGIESMKRLAVRREAEQSQGTSLLPGETEE